MGNEKKSFVGLVLLGALFACALVLVPWTAPLAGGDDGEETPYTFDADGNIDFATYNGYRRFHGTCHRCHGFNGEGGFAPSLVIAMKTLSYEDFLDIVVNGSSRGTSVMPPFGESPNIMNYIDDIHAYLKARADGVLPPGRPKHVEKTLD